MPVNIVTSGSATVDLVHQTPRAIREIPVRPRFARAFVAAALALAWSTTLPAAELVGHWDFEGQSLANSGSAGSVHDGVSRNGSVAFTADTPSGRGSAIDLTQSDAYVEILNTGKNDGSYRNTFDGQLSGGLTISAWVKGIPGEWRPYVSKFGEDGYGYQLRHRGNSGSNVLTLRGTNADDDPQANVRTDDGNWHLITGTWNPSTGIRDLYVDGVLDLRLTGDTGGIQFADGEHLLLGNRERGGGGDAGAYAKVLLDEVRVYRGALTGQEVLDLYHGDLLTVSVTSLAGFEGELGIGSAAQTFEMTYAGPVMVMPPAGFEVSLDGESYSDILNLTSGSSASIHVRVAAAAPLGDVSGDLVVSSGGASHTVTLSGGVVYAVTPSVATLTGFTADYGSASASQQFTLTGNSPDPYTVTAPEGYEVSVNGVDFAGSVTLPGRVSLTGSTSPDGSVWLRGTGSNRLARNAVAALQADGSVVTWGDSRYGGSSQNVASLISSDVVSVSESLSAFAALKADGSVVSWGKADSGGDSTAVAEALASGVVSIHSTGGAFAALKTDGSVVTWGLPIGGGDSTAVADQLGSGVVAIRSTIRAFAAIKNDGSVVTWGDSESGGDSSAVAADLASGVADIFPTISAFAALKENGSVVTWGDPAEGGDSSAVTAGLASGVSHVYSNYYAFAALKEDGTVVTWGSSADGGDSSTPTGGALSDVVSIVGNRGAFAALKTDGKVVAWGKRDNGGALEQKLENTFEFGYFYQSIESGLNSSTVTALYSTGGAFAALKANGSVVSWGDGQSGGDKSYVHDLIQSGVTAIYPNAYAFAALKSDGSVVTWGDPSNGGNTLPLAASLASGVSVVHAYENGFVALKDNGSLVAWGASSYGAPASLITVPEISVRLASGSPIGDVTGDLVISSGTVTKSVPLSGVVVPSVGPSSSSLAGFTTEAGTASSTQTVTLDGKLSAPLQVSAPAGWEVSTDGISFSSELTVADLEFANATIYSTTGAFAALKADGSVVTWGSSGLGGDSRLVAERLSSEVTAIYSNPNAFAALKSDGSVVTWGFAQKGGNSYNVADQLSSGVTAIYSNPNAFAALKSDGSVVTWGESQYGGDSSSVESLLTSGVTTVSATKYAFAALKSDGSVVAWGGGAYGGDSSSVAAQLQSGVKAICSDDQAFAALKEDGSVVTWGNSQNGGDSSSVATQLSSEVSAIYSTGQAFAALKENGSVVTWGYNLFGGDSSAVAGQLTSGVAAVYSTRLAFAALKEDGSVVTWGYFSTPGVGFSSVQNQLASGVTTIYSTDQAFAALKANGSVVTWGPSGYGGDSSAIAGELGSGVTAIYSYGRDGSAFVALKEDGSAVAWGDPAKGGDSSAVAGQLASGVTAIYSTSIAFAALKEDGSVVVWGNENAGASGAPANIGSFLPTLPPTFPVTLHMRLAADAPVGAASGDLTLTSEGAPSRTVSLSGTVQSWIAASTEALDGFAATPGTASESQSFTVQGILGSSMQVSAPAGWEVSTDGSSFSSELTLSPTFPVTLHVRLAADAPLGVASGDLTLSSGGASETVTLSGVQEWIGPSAEALEGFTTELGAASTAQTFSVAGALSGPLQVSASTGWEVSTDGISFSSELTVAGPEVVNGTIFSTVGAFAALKGDGSVVTWGSSSYGGDSSAVENQLASGVTAIYSNVYAFAALKSDGSVVTWGDSSYGGDSSAVAGQLTSGVTAIYSTRTAFAALKENGSVVTWGNST